MADKKEAVDKADDGKKRKAYNAAQNRLKELHRDEWITLLSEEYSKAGVEVRRRLTDEEREGRRKKALAEKRGRLQAELEKLDAELGIAPGSESE